MKCVDKDIAIKSFFLGPQAENALWLERSIHEILSRWFYWRKHLYPQDGKLISHSDQKTKHFIQNQKKIDELIRGLLTRFENEIPHHSPRYIGHMFSEISLPALLGHIITLLHNPNNVSSESARVSIFLEKEAIEMLMEMIGYNPKSGAGHFTSGGTVANFEALFRAQKRLEFWLKTTTKLDSKRIFWGSSCGWDVAKENYNSIPDSEKFVDQFQKFLRQNVNPIILAPASYHYSWPKGASFMGLGSNALWPVELDEHGKMCTQDLQKKLEKAYRDQRPVLMLVSVVGSTELGTLDPIDKTQNILEKWQKRGIHIWHHIDAAYGGFFASIKNEAKKGSLELPALKALNSLNQTTSLTIDPHKLGYVPYSSGAFLVNNKFDYFLTSQNPPYIQFDFNIDPGPFTLEGSRSAAGSIATWLCGKSIGFHGRGYGRILNRTIKTRKKLEKNLTKIRGIQVLPCSETNIICFTIAKPYQSLKTSNEVTEYYIKDSYQRNAFFVSKTTIHLKKYRRLTRKFLKKWNPHVDDDKIICVRICLMNPFLDSKEGKTNFIKEFCQDLKNQID